MSNTTSPKLSLALAVSFALAAGASAQIQGPSSSQTPFVLPTGPNSGYTTTTSVLTVGDTIGGYKMAGIPDGLGAFDNGNGTFTVLMNHEISTPSGVAHTHNPGGNGSFVSKWVVDKNTLQVLSGGDLMQQVYGWDSANQVSNAAPGVFNFSRFCSADLAAPTAYYNAATGLGSTARIFMHGEEGSATGWQQATVATGADAGKSYTLGKFNLSTNGSGLTGVGAWENALANPLPQDKTVVIGNNDGGTGIMSNSLAVYVGTKQNTGSEVQRAGLTNGTLKFVTVTGNAVEITNGTTRATNITSGTGFTLSSTASTTFSRPEDGAWNPANPNQYYFVTTDRLDQVSDGVGAQVGATRLWRLNFNTVTNPDLGGTIDLLLDGASAFGTKTNMFDNMTVGVDGKIYLQEDVGNAAHNGKIWEYDPSNGSLVQFAKHDTVRFGDIGIAGPITQDEETSGIIDITDIMAGSLLNYGTPGEKWLLSSDQAHQLTGDPTTVENGQLFTLHAVPEPGTALWGALLGLTAGVRRIRNRRA